MSISEAFEQFFRRYRPDPVLFVREVLGVEPDPWQVDLLRAIQHKKRRISVRSGHGVGKSSAASWAMIWYMLCHYPVKVVVTAPTSGQLYDALFAELKHWLNELPPMLRGLVEVTSDRVELKAAPESAFISARTSRAEKPEALQGIHSEHVMLVADEASGIPEQVFDAAQGSMSGENAVTILLGNPVRSSGYFYDTHNRLRDSWYCIHVNGEKTPRVSREFIKEVAERSGIDSNEYRIRVLGEFPLADDDTVIPMDYIVSAIGRDLEDETTSAPVWGVDIARFGNDSSALVKRKSIIVPEPPKIWAGANTMTSAGIVANEYETTPPALRPSAIYVDAIGLGAGVADRLIELKLPAVAINVAEASAMNTKYANLKAELWFAARDWLGLKNCRLPAHDKLRDELAAVRYAYTSNGRLQIEDKATFKKRTGYSPDVADAFVLTFAGGGAVGLYGSIKPSGWGKPLRRGLRV